MKSEVHHIGLIVFAIAISVCGCAGVTDVVPTGSDTYMVASHGTMGWSSGPAQKANAFQKATDFCKAKNSRVEAIGTSETPSGFGQIASGEVQFKCVPMR